MLLKTFLNSSCWVQDWDEVRQCTAKITPVMYLPVKDPDFKWKLLG